MKNKNLTQAVLCILAASMFFGGGIQVGETADTITSDKTFADGETYKVSKNDDEATGIYANSSNSNLKITVDNNATLIAKSTNSPATGIDVYGASSALIDGNGKLNIGVEGNSAVYGISIYIPSSKLTVNPELDINVKNTDSKYSDVMGIINQGEGIFNNAISINVETTVDNETYGIYSDGNLTFNNKVNINSISPSNNAIGICLQYNSSANFFNDISINTDGNEKYAIYNDEDSKLSISKQLNSLKDTDAVNVNIKGNIITQDSSQTTINAGADSKIEGFIYTDDPSVDTTNLALHNDATWNNTGSETSTLNNLVMNNGVINQNSDQDINILNYSGTGKVLFTAEPTADSNAIVQINKGDITIGQAAENSVLNADLANNSKINTLDSSKTEENLNAIAKKITYTANDGNITGTVKLQEGLITPAVSADLNFDANKQGYVTNVFIDTRDTETMNAMRHIGAASISSWRQEDSTLGQRLGTLRESKDDGGIWVRMNRGKYEYANALNGQYNFFQMGYDKAFGDWHYGAAVSHNDDKTSYANGKGNNDSTSLALYGTWLGNAGHYADIVLKEGRLSTDYDIYAPAGYTHGKYNNWGTAISGEYGRKIAFKDFYLTPQAQLTFMRIGGKNYTTANDIHVEQDNLYSTVGRIGVEIGKNIADKGNAYLRTSLLHEFAGDADTHLTLNGISNSYTQDIGNTWYELGVGFNYQTAANSYLYADVAKTFGDDYRTPWQWNVGMRWNF